MPSLTECMRKAGKALHSEDRAAILARAAELRADGKTASEAGMQAVSERLAEVGRIVVEWKPEAPKIDDAGEKIGGARKDRWAERGLDVSDLDAMAEGEGAEMATKANVWKPDYQAIAAQAEPVTAAMVKVVYDSLAAKPRQNTPQGRRDYVRAMQAVRKVYGAVKTVQEANEAHRALRAELGIPAVRMGLTELSEAQKEARRVLFSVYKGRSDPFVLGYNELARAKKLVQDGFPGEIEPWTRRFAIRGRDGHGITEAGMRMYLRESADAGTPLTEEQIGAGFFEVRDKAGQALAYLPTKADAVQAARALYEASKAKGDEKQEPSRPHLEDITREGLDPAIDRDATPQDLLDAFGFRGVEWGNWSAQDERQRILNMAFDALTDLAKIVGVPRRALSLNGTLGMAFGARGSGRALAHYEPGKLVINMTKLRGAGSLAHEWAHALDHYLGELDRGDAYQTKARGVSGWYDQRAYTGRDAPKNVRPELAAAIDRVMQRLYEGSIDKPTMLAELQAQLERTKALAAGEDTPRLKKVYTDSLEQQQRRIDEVKAAPDGTTYPRGKSDYSKEAQKLSGKSASGYWLRPTEMWARAFESYVFDRLVAMGAKSEYLVHGVEQDRYADATRFKGNPYPAGKERAAINEAFDAFVAELKTRETEKGTALFSRAAPFVEVVDQGGFPTFVNQEAGIVIGYPQVTERFEVVEQPGEQVVNYAIMPAHGFDVLGMVELLVKDGKPSSLLDIEITAEGRKEGVGTKVVGTLLAANPSVDLNISNIVPAARGFWAKMGVPERNVGPGDAYDGTLNWQTYQEAQPRDAGAASGGSQGSRATGEEPDAGAAKGLRGATSEAQRLSRDAESSVGESSGRAFWRKIADGEQFAPQEIEDAYALGRRGLRRTGRSVERNPGRSQLGQARFDWQDSLAGFAGYSTVGNWSDASFVVSVVPDELAAGRDLTDAAAVADAAAVQYVFTKTSQGFDLSVNDPQFNGSAYKALEERGRLLPAGTEQKPYARLRLDNPGSTSRVLLQEAIRRLAMSTGEIPTVVQAGRDTGARKGTSEVRVFSPQTIEAKFKRGEGARGMTASAVNVVAGALTTAGAPIKVVQSVDDLPDNHRKALLAADPSGRVRGAYFKGADQIYLVASNIGDQKEALHVALHEAFHRGLAKTIGPQATKLLTAMRMTNGKLRALALEQQAMHRLGIDEATEEALAELAGKGEVRDLRGWDKLVKLIRDFLSGVAEKVGLKMTWTDDMIADFVAATARAGLNQEAQVNSGDQTKTEAFRRWFGDSKVVDADGKPLVVYHGTNKDITKFKPGRGGGAIWFASTPKLANLFVGGGRRSMGEGVKSGSAVYSVYLSLKNPLNLGNTAPQDKLSVADVLRMADLPADAQALRKIAVANLSSGYAFVSPSHSDPAGYFVNEYMRPTSRASNTLDNPGLIDALQAAGYDGLRMKEEGAITYAAFRPEQIKSAIGNRGTFDPGNSDIRLSRVADAIREQTLPAGYKVADLLQSHGKLSVWDKTVGTMHNLAERNPLFKRVYDSAQDFLNDVSYYATKAADMAPTLLPKLESLRDITKAPLSAEDTKALAGPVFEGTLRWTRDEAGKPIPADDVGTAGVVWSDDELRSNFKLNARQIGLYREFRAATDKSLTDLAISDMLRFAGKDAEKVAQQAMESGNVAEAGRIITDHLAEMADADSERAGVLIETGTTIREKAARAADLMARGYAPLSRFGQYSLDVTKGGQRLYFGLFETQREANKMARKLKESYPDAEFSQGTVSQEAYKLFAGVSPETLELFGDMLGLEAQGDDAAAQAFQTYLKVAKSNRSAMKRLIERKGVEGFSEDAGRVLAGFVYSNSRQASKNLHFGKITEATQAIADEKGRGELMDSAVRLHQYITNPQEEAHKLKGLMFTNFLGGSLAAGMVNLTQTAMVTFPYLTQYGGVAAAAKQMKAALTDALRWELADASKRTTGNAALDAAMKKAEEEGIVSPQEVHQLLAQAGGKGALRSGDGTLAGNMAARGANIVSKLMLAWGKPFAIAEQFNRRVAFIAAYRTAVANDMENPAKFAEHAVTETQFAYTKANRPEWARGAIGSTLFTFKTFSISYIELLARMANNGPEGKKAALVGLAMLFLVSGMQGLPGADDLDDLIDGLMQRLGYNFSSKQAKLEFFANILGEDGARFVMKGASGLPGAPIDVAGRLGLGNLIPGTGLLTKKTDYGSDVAELAGPVGSFAKQLLAGASKAVEGEFGQATQAMLPVALQNVTKAYDMASTGMYRDSRGRKVLDVDGIDAAFKAIGFQPGDVAKVQQAASEVQKLVALNKMREGEIAEKWAKAIFEHDAEAVAEARAELSQWNADNPTSRISITPSQIAQRVKEMRMDKATRLAKTAPKEIRAEVRRELEAAQ